MKGHGAKFRQKRELAIAALLSQRSAEAAAGAVGISANTLLRWMKLPEFEDEFQKARRRAFSHAIGRLQDAADPAVTTLLKMMLAGNERTRLQAALAVLDGGAKAYGMEALEALLANLERLAGLARKLQEHSEDLTCFSTRSLSGPARTQAQIAARPAEITPPTDTAETNEDVDE